ERFEEAVTEVRQVIETPPVVPEAEPTRTDQEDEDEDPDEEAATPPPGPPFPQVEVKRVLEVAIDARKTADRKDPELAIRGAVERLMQVRPEDIVELLQKPEGQKIREALAQITAWLEAVNG